MLAFDGNNNLQVTTPQTIAQAGFTFLAGTGMGGALATSPKRPLAASSNGRLEIANISPLFTDTFNYTAQDTGRWNVVLTTFTNTFVTGYCILNGGAVTTANAVAVMKSYWTHPLPTEGALVLRAFALYTQVPQTNNVMELGSFPLVAGTGAIPDGFGLRWDATGVLKGFTNYNGTELMTGAVTAPTSGVNHSYEFVVDGLHVEFWIDGVMVGSLLSPTGTGQPMMSPYVQPTFRIYNSASVPALAQQLKISDVDVWQTDANPGRPSAYYRAEQGQMGYCGVGGMTMGSTANFANSANPAAAVPTNTTAALGSGLGGQFWETCTLAVNTDGIICSYQCPVAALGLPARKLVITGVRISSAVQTILAGGPFVNVHTLAFGHTTVSLAQGEAAGTKAPRRLPLGIQTFAATAPVGTKGQDIVLTLSSPVVVMPGEFVAVTTKNIGTVGTAGTLAHAITFDSHWA